MEVGTAALGAEEIKLDHYAELSHNYIVMPVAVETLGPFAQMGMKFIKEIGSRLTAQNGDKRAISFIFQSISMAVQRGNVGSIRGSVPNAKILHELFYL